MFTEDLSAFFQDFAVLVTAGGLSTPAILDAPDDSVLGDRATSTQYAITFVARALGDLPYLSTVNVSGTPNAQFDGAYRVRAKNNIEDGRMQRAVLEFIS